MEIPKRYKVIAAVSAVLLTLCALLVLASFAVASLDTDVLTVVIPVFLFPIVIIGLILTVISRHRTMRGLFLAYLSAGILLWVLAFLGLPENSILHNRIACRILSWCTMIVSAAPMVLCWIFQRKLALLLSFGGSDAYRKAKKAAWEQEVNDFYRESVPKKAAPLDLKAVADQAYAAQQDAAEAKAVHDPSKSQEPLDVNSCAPEALAGLPGMSISSANKAVALRQEAAYISADDFVARNQIKPHFAVQILPRIIAQPVKAEQPVPTKHRGLDL